MRAPEGNDHWSQGVYREIVEPERLVFTWAWEDAEGKPGHETLLTVTFAEQGERRSSPCIRPSSSPSRSRDAHGGWIAHLDRLAEYLAKA